MRPRVAYVISTTTGGGGAERLLTKLVEEGAVRGWDQLVLNPFARELPAAFAHLPSDVYRLRSCGNVLGVPSVRSWMRAELDCFEPDVVHVMLFHALVLVATLPRRPGRSHLVTHVYGEGIESEPGAAVKVPLDRWAGARFDRIVAISESVRRFLVSRYGYSPSKVVTIPPGWTGDPLPPSGADRPPTVTCVAKLRPEKGHDLLLAAFPLVRQKVPDARLVLVGDGDLRPGLEAEAKARGIADCVEFTGAVDSIWPYLAEADVFVLASQSEAFGMAIVEAMGAGLPVVAPAVGGIPELVVPGVTGELFPPGDQEALADRLVKLLTSPDARAAMADAARATAEALRMENTIPRYFDVYAELRAAAGVRA